MLTSVRCCADEGDQETASQGTSCLTCGELGWPAGLGSTSVCAASEIAGSAQSGLCVTRPVSYDIARQLCLILDMYAHPYPCQVLTSARVFAPSR